MVNTRSIRHSYTKLVTRDCGSGTVVVAQENLENIIPAEKNIRIEFGGMQDKTAHLDELILGTRNPGGTLSVDLAPATVLQSYPGLSGTLNTAHLIFNYAAPQQMATAVRQVIEYAIEQWRIQHNAPSVLYALQVSVNAPTPGSGKISIVLGVYHQPTQAYVCLQPTVSTLSGYQDQGVYTTTAASVDGQGSVQLLAEAAYVVQACNATIRRDYNVTIGYGSNQVTPEGWYTIESGLLSAVPLGGQTSSAPCQETPVVINCETEGEVCAGAACVPCLPAEPVAPLCSGAELAALPQQLADLDQLMTQTGVNDLLFPIVLYRLRFCDGSRRYVFDRELGGIDADYVMEQRLIVRSAADLYRLTYNNGASGQIGAVDVILSQRPGNNGLLITPLPSLQQSSAPGDPLSGDNPGNEGAGRPQVSYYNYDHLGNTRVVYHSVINCVSDSVHYVLEYAADYYPFGAILREWENCEKSRFLFTYKERDAETGWDNLGARLYDSDVCRFLGVDPIADQFPHVNPYNYAENEPVANIDLHGLQAVSIEIAMDRDVEELVEGKIDEQEYWARAQARFQGGVTGLGGAGIGGIVKKGVQSLIAWTVSNPVSVAESLKILGGLIWGLGTDAEAPGGGDNLGRSIKKSRILDGMQELSDEVTATIRGGSRYSIYGGIENAGGNLIYIGTKGELPYIGKTSTTITARYYDPKEAPLPFIDYFNAPSEKLLDIEAAIIDVNGGPKSGRIANKYRSSGDANAGREWLNRNVPNWEIRFKY